MKYFLRSFVAVLIVLVQPLIASACTIFVVRHDGKVYFCNNEDFTKPGCIWFTPAKSGKYGRVNFGFDDKFAQGSMNEKRLTSLFRNSPSLDEIRAREQRAYYDTRIELSDKELDRFTGTYSPETDRSVKFAIRRKDGKLLVDNPGQPTAELFPESPTSFRISPDRGQVTFVSDTDDDARVTGLILHKGRDLRAVWIEH